MAFQPATERIWSIARLTAEIKSTLGNAFPAVWVKGELSSVKRHSNGHLYFALKDAHARIDAVMFRLKLQRMPFDPVDGMQVEAFGAVSVYEAQGRYQLVVEDMKPAGLGQLLAAMEKLRQQLQAEGLFDAARKRPLPRYPATIGIVTSPVGAAVRDMVKVLRARWPSLKIVIAPVKVQGQTAAREIADAVARFNRLPGVDVLIVGRGGGAPEDLWAFNEEPVVRAIAASRIPVISAVGHESDTTLADFAAAVRAATPSHAAEIAVRDRGQVAKSVGECAAGLRRAMDETLARRRRRLEQLLAAHGFRRHDDVIAMHQKHVDDLLERARRATLTRLEHLRRRLAHAGQRYGLREAPRRLVHERRERVAMLGGRLAPAIVEGVRRRHTHIEGAAARLHALGPQRVLERGYCLARGPDGTLVRAAESLRPGDAVVLQFARGDADARVETVRPGGDDAR